MYAKFIATVGLIAMTGGIAMAEEQNDEVKTEQELQIEQANARKAVSEADKAASDAAKAASDARKAEIDAERAAVLATLPTTETKGLQGTVTAEGDDYYPTHLAHKALDTASTNIASDISQIGRIQTYDLFLVGSLDVQAAASKWRFIDAQLSVIEAGADSVIESMQADGSFLYTSDESPFAALGLGLTALPQILGGIADIAAFFKVNINSRAIATKAGKGSLDALIVKKLLDSGEKAPKAIFVPGLSMSRENALTKRISKLASKLAQLRSKKDEIIIAAAAAAKDSDLNIKAHDAKIAKLTADIAKETDEEKKKSLEEELVTEKFKKGNEEIQVKFAKSVSDQKGARLTQLIDEGEKLITALTTPGDDKLSPLQKADPIAALISSKNPALLTTILVSQGGARQEKTSAFSSGKLSYLGGVVVTFQVTDRDGKILKIGSYSFLETQAMKRGTFSTESEE